MSGRDGGIEVSAMEERVGCWGWGWGWERDEAQIIWSAVGPFTPLATNPNSQTTDIYSLPATTATLPLPASSGAWEIAANPGSVPTLACRTKRGGPEMCVRWSVYIPRTGSTLYRGEDPNPRP